MQRKIFFLLAIIVVSCSACASPLYHSPALDPSIVEMLKEAAAMSISQDVEFKRIVKDAQNDNCTQKN